jgi:hypothetical protein
MLDSVKNSQIFGGSQIGGVGNGVRDEQVSNAAEYRPFEKTIVSQLFKKLHALCP